MERYTLNRTALRLTLKRCGITYGELAKTLTERGYPIKEGGIKQWFLRDSGLCKPSTPGIEALKIISEVTNTPINHFVESITDSELTANLLPLIAEASGSATFVPSGDINGYVAYFSPRYKRGMFALKVVGNVFANDHICDGNIIICSPADEVKNGDIVAAEIDGRYLIRLYQRDDERRIVKLLAKSRSQIVDDITLDADTIDNKCRLSKIVESRNEFGD